MKYQDNQHFSHHHVLVSLKLDEGDEINCNGCKRLIYEPFHGCLSCNFYLHDDCLNTPRFLQHPSHPHSLTLLPTPTYSSRSYFCNACGSSGGNAFSLCCAQCEFDLHVHCANLPTTMLLDKHPHELKFIFGSPYEDKSTRFGCDLCSGGMLPNCWLYYCADCDFATHLECASDKPKPNAAQRKTQETKEENQGAHREESNRGNAAQRKTQNTTEENQSSRREASDIRNSVYEAQRKMRETTIAQRVMLQALDNAADYVGPSSRAYYYY